jgi:hypothetical protein
MRLWPLVTLLAYAGPPLISQARQLSSIMMVRQQRARRASI